MEAENGDEGHKNEFMDDIVWQAHTWIILEKVNKELSMGNHEYLCLQEALQQGMWDKLWYPARLQERPEPSKSPAPDKKTMFRNNMTSSRFCWGKMESTVLGFYVCEGTLRPQ